MLDENDVCIDLRGYILFNNIGIWLVLKFVIGTYNSSVDMVFDVFVTLYYTVSFKQLK